MKKIWFALILVLSVGVVGWMIYGKYGYTEQEKCDNWRPGTIAVKGSDTYNFYYCI